MRFEWDAAKSNENFTRRGFDFEFATLVFDGPCLAVDDTRRDYGERRVVAIGLADGVHLTVVFTDRPGPEGSLVRRIVSARLSNRKERRLHDQLVQAIEPPQSRLAQSPPEQPAQERPGQEPGP